MVKFTPPEFLGDCFIPHLENCPVCGEKDASKRRRCSTISKSLNMYYLQCRTCFAISSSHYVRKDVLDAYYAQYYKKPGNEFWRTSKEDMVTIDDPVGFAKHIAAQLFLKVDNVKILDFGGGCGLISYHIALELLKRSSVKSVDILVVDYEENTYQGNHPNIHLSSVKKLPSGRATFNLVMASAVLEHIFFVEDTFRKLFECVDKGGYFYVRAPYIQPIYKMGLAVGIKIDALFPEHVHDFSKHFFEKSLETFNQTDFNIVTSQPSFIETTFEKNFLACLISHVVRSPYNLWKEYPFVGGWEVVYQRNETEN